MVSRERLDSLARLYGIELGYRDAFGRDVGTSNEPIVRILRHLGVDASTPETVDAALSNRRRELADRILEPVHVFWEDAAPVFAMRVPSRALGGRYKVELRYEQGARHTQTGEIGTLRVIERFEVEGGIYADLEVRLSERMPFGYHQLRVELDDAVDEALAVSAPIRAFQPDEPRMWGLFTPTYALESPRSVGTGGFAELARFVDLTQAAGGHVVATLPLLAAFLDEPFQPSPYIPVSRLFWNEMFLDLHQLAHQQGSEAARIALADPDFLAEAERLREAPLVDYLAQARLHRSVLEILAREVYENGGTARDELEAWVRHHPRVADYARFRAVTEARRSAWQTWPERLREGRLEAGDYDDEAYRYHLYAQWRAEQQLGELGDRARAAGGGLYLDLPLGVHPDGYDAWRERSLFLDGLNAGAPPDALGPDGQDWGFRPLDPEALRRDHYRYFIECIQTQVRHAGVLRIDHVMGLHRLFCVPWGGTGADGIYLRYRPEELWAIVTLESRRHGAMIVGEDLGTVPDEVRETMSRHGVHRMFVLQFELDGDRSRAIREVPAGAVASLNTHDTPTFAGFWEDRDLEDREALGTLSAEDGRNARDGRDWLKGALCGFLQDRGLVGVQPDLDQIYRGAVRHLARGPAQLVLLNVEDLWLEEAPQNVPGTSDERPNWRRKLRYTLDAIGDLPSVQATLAAVAADRADTVPGPSPAVDTDRGAARSTFPAG